MPKFQCLNKDCIKYEEIILISKITSSYDKLQSKMIVKEAYCNCCKQYMIYVKEDVDLKSIQAPKTGMMTYAEKMQMLKKRSKDQRIPANKEIAERKQYLDTH